MKDTIILANPNPHDIERLDSIVRPYFTKSVTKSDVPHLPISSQSTFEDAASQQAVSASKQLNEFVVSSSGGEVDKTRDDERQWCQAIAIARNGKLLFSTEVESDIVGSGGFSQLELKDQSWQRLKRMLDWFVEG